MPAAVRRYIYILTNFREGGELSKVARRLYILDQAGISEVRKQLWTHLANHPGLLQAKDPVGFPGVEIRLLRIVQIVGHRHAEERPLGAIHRGFPQLVRVHLTQAFVAFDRQPAAPDVPPKRAGPARQP